MDKISLKKIMYYICPVLSSDNDGHTLDSRQNLAILNRGASIEFIILYYSIVKFFYSMKKGSFGDVSLNELAGYIFNVFNVKPDRNISRTFGDMKIRNHPTPYFDAVLAALKRRINYIGIPKKKKKEN